MPRLIRMSPSESNSTTLRSGRASAKPSANPAWPPIAGSPSGRSRCGSLVNSTQKLAATPRHDDRVATMRLEGGEGFGDAHHGSLRLPVEAVELVANQDDDRPFGFLGFLER